VHYDAETMLAVLALEAHQADGSIVGEDWAPSNPKSPTP
jgi:4-alpha-glucanotransferase